MLFARYRLTDSSEELKGKDHAGVDWKNHEFRSASVWLLARRAQPAIFSRG
jgi:hypothetical protein